MIESDFDIKELREVGVVLYDCEHSTPPDEGSGYPYIAIPNIKDGHIVLDGVRRINRDQLEKWNRRVTPRAGDIILTRRGRVGDSAVVPVGMQCAIGQNLVILRAESAELDQGYLRWSLRGPHFESELGRLLNVGAVFNSLNCSDIPKFRITVPPLAEQQAIADVLGALDDKIESNRRIVKQLDLLLLAHSISLSALPTVALREVSKSYRRPVNPLTLGDEWVDHFSLPAFDVAALPERCRASTIMSGKFGIETTSVLISRLNPGTPRVWCAHVREVSAMSSSEFLVLEPLNTSSVGALWLAAVHPTLGEQMVQRATGTSFSHQRIKSDDALSVEVPDIRLIDEQTRVECDELIEMVGKRRSETEHLSRLRDALLPELLSGRLRVKDAESMMENV